jgi:hypothetical protein
MWHTWQRKENCTGFWRDSPKESDHLKDRSVDRKTGLEWNLGRLVKGAMCAVKSSGSG